MKRVRDENENHLVDLEEFACQTSEMFDAWFTRKMSSNFSNFMMRYYDYTFRQLAGSDNRQDALYVFHETLREKISQYWRYIDCPIRGVPFVRHHYWDVYLILRLGVRVLPIDIIWMILERLQWTLPIQKDTIRQAARICIQQASYFKRYCIYQADGPPHDSIFFLWDDMLADALMVQQETNNPTSILYSKCHLPVQLRCTKNKE